MSFRCLKLLKTIKSAAIVRNNLFSTSVAFSKNTKLKEFRTEQNLRFYEDPDIFGTLSQTKTYNDELDDEDDIKEEKYLQEAPVLTQKLTTKQYADIIKQYLKHKRLKEAINVLEVRMLKEDRVKPENYIYNILIGACADVGYTKKAFKLFNEMKRRDLKPTGDTYTCLFQACSNSPWQADGLKHAKHLRELMIEKGVSPNLTNYNAMIKAFGRCGDLSSAFQIVDEMIAQKIKIRVHTLNHLLQACISDKENGLRHAIIVWRKMLKLREKPNIYSFNLMLKCVKDCNLGTKSDIEELVSIIQEQIMLDPIKNNLMISNANNQNEEAIKMLTAQCVTPNEKNIKINEINVETHNKAVETDFISEQPLSKVLENINEVNLIVQNHVDVQLTKAIQKKENDRIVPNLLSKVLHLQQVLMLQEVNLLQDKFAVVGGQEDFLKEMEYYSVKPDIKTFTQMVPLIDETTEAENKLLETMKSLDIKADIDFYNMLIRKRCFRSDYNSAFEIKQIIEEENKIRKKKHPLKKKLRLKPNIMTYGVLALACVNKQSAEELLNVMKEKQIKVNIVILSSLLRQGTAHNNFDYIMYILNVVREENINVNDVFLKHLESFIGKCSNLIKQQKTKEDNTFVKSYKLFLKEYKKFLKDVNIEDVLNSEHPWQQFKDVYPETLQRQPIKIEEPKRFYKRNRKYVPYAPKK